MRLHYTTRRTIKKRSKQSAEILRQHYAREISPIFLSERGDNYHDMNVRCTHLRRPGRFRCDCIHPLRGTPMTGEVSGYYEPEWSERTAWQELARLIEWGEKPATMTDREWERAQRVTRTRPVTEAEIRRMYADDDAPAEVDANSTDDAEPKLAA